MSEELDIKEIFKFIFKKKKILLYIVIVSILVGSWYTFIGKRPVYEIDAKILIDKADTSIEEFITSKDILTNNKIEVEFDKTTKLINASIKPRKFEKEQSLKDLNSYIDKLEKKLKDTYSVKTYNLIQKPQIPEKSTNATYLKDIGMALVIGIVIYFVYILVCLNFRGIVSGSQIESIGLRLLGLVNQEKIDTENKIKNNLEKSKISEQLKRIQTNIELNKEIKNPKIILFTGAKKGVGTSYITKNLAKQYTKIYNNVLIVDADIINKTLTKEFLKKEQVGLTDCIYLNESKSLKKYIIHLKEDNLFLLPVGKNDIIEETFLKEETNNILEELKENFDIILIDGMPIDESISSTALSSFASETIIVAESEKTKQDDILRIKSTIDNVGGKVIGVILNKVM